MRDLELMVGKLYWKTLKVIQGQNLMHLAAIFPGLHNAIEATLNNRISPQEKKLLHRLRVLRADIRTRTTKLTLSHSQKSFSVTPRELADRASVPDHYGTFLFKLVRELKPKICLEIGTCIGISAAYQAIALKLNGAGRLFSLEDQETLVLFANNLLNDFGLDNVQVITGHAIVTMENLLQEYGPVDYAFIDGDHKGNRALYFFNKIVANITDGGLIILDDIWYNLGMIKAWRTITRDSRVKVSASLFRTGICLIDKKMSTKKHFVL